MRMHEGRGGVSLPYVTAEGSLSPFLKRIHTARVSREAGVRGPFACEPAEFALP